MVLRPTPGALPHGALWELSVADRMLPSQRTVIGPLPTQAFLFSLFFRPSVYFLCFSNSEVLSLSTP